MEIKFTSSARLQFLKALAYIRRDNPEAALKFRRKAEKSLRRLSDFSESGRAIPEFPELPHREPIVAPYRFFYRTIGETVWIIAVWHGAQLPPKP